MLATSEEQLSLMCKIFFRYLVLVAGEGAISQIASWTDILEGLNLATIFFFFLLFTTAVICSPLRQPFFVLLLWNELVNEQGPSFFSFFVRMELKKKRK